MASPWRTLRDAGLPLVGERGSPPGERAVALAVLELLDSREPPGEREQDALVAFVRAFAHHFPATFARAFGSDAARVQAWADASVRDVNRYLKLRRIAIENLSRVF